jgi:hypothetical protein
MAKANAVPDDFDPTRVGGENEAITHASVGTFGGMILDEGEFDLACPRPAQKFASQRKRVRLAVVQRNTRAGNMPTRHPVGDEADVPVLRSRAARSPRSFLEILGRIRRVPWGVAHEEDVVGPEIQMHVLPMGDVPASRHAPSAPTHSGQGAERGKRRPAHQNRDAVNRPTSPLAARARSLGDGRGGGGGGRARAGERRARRREVGLTLARREVGPCAAGGGRTCRSRACLSRGGCRFASQERGVRAHTGRGVGARERTLVRAR